MCGIETDAEIAYCPQPSRDVVDAYNKGGIQGPTTHVDHADGQPNTTMLFDFLSSPGTRWNKKVIDLYVELLAADPDAGSARSRDYWRELVELRMRRLKGFYTKSLARHVYLPDGTTRLETPEDVAERYTNSVAHTRKSVRVYGRVSTVGSSCKSVLISPLTLNHRDSTAASSIWSQS